MTVHIPTQLRVQGTVPLTDKDRARTLDYQAHFVGTGAAAGDALKSACLQIGQDLLGGVGFDVEGVWPGRWVRQEDSEWNGWPHLGVRVDRVTAEGLAAILVTMIAPESLDALEGELRDDHQFDLLRVLREVRAERNK